MDPESIVDELLRSDIVGSSADGDLSISPAFEDAVADERSRIEGADSPREYLAATLDDEGTVETLCAVEDDVAYLAHYLALVERVPDLSRRAAFRTATVLLTLRGPPPEASGAPEGFLPVRGDRLETLIRLNERAVIYVWLEDCPTCDLMKEDLATVLADATDVSRFAIYGPNWAEELSAYDVEGGPTTLFVLDGRIDARLHGAHYPQVIESEVETLRDLSAP